MSLRFFAIDFGERLKVYHYGQEFTLPKALLFQVQHFEHFDGKPFERTEKAVPVGVYDQRMHHDYPVFRFEDLE